MEQFQQTIAKIDAINAEDPHIEIINGQEIPKELLYSQRMSTMLNDFEPDASEYLRIAARAQHIKRWSVPRDSFPMDRKGYLLWRTQLKKFHGELAGSIMRDRSYAEEEVKKVEDLLIKRNLKSDPEAQTLEDVACLVFLKYYFEDFIKQHEEDKVISIVQKTWRKMSKRGQDAALALPMPREARGIIQQALTSNKIE